MLKVDQNWTVKVSETIFSLLYDGHLFLFQISDKSLALRSNNLNLPKFAINLRKQMQNDCLHTRVWNFIRWDNAVRTFSIDKLTGGSHVLKRSFPGSVYEYYLVAIRLFAALVITPNYQRVDMMHLISYSIIFWFIQAKGLH